ALSPGRALPAQAQVRAHRRRGRRRPRAERAPCGPPCRSQARRLGPWRPVSPLKQTGLRSQSCRYMAPVASPASRRPRPAGGRMEGAARVLIVEDDRSVREMTAEYLASRGYVVEKAASSEAMREAIAVRVPDLVLLDLNLPGEDGLSAACHLRERHGVGIIMVTGATDLADRVAGLEAGADDYVAKPFEPRELLARVKSVLRRT